MLTKMDYVKNTVDPDQPDGISNLSSASQASTSTSRGTHVRRRGHSKHRYWTNKNKTKNSSHYSSLELVRILQHSATPPVVPAVTLLQSPNTHSKFKNLNPAYLRQFILRHSLQEKLNKPFPPMCIMQYLNYVLVL